MQSHVSQGRAAAALAVCGLLLGGCVFLPSAAPVAPAPVVAVIPRPDPTAPRLQALESRHLTLASADQEMVGEPQVLFTRYENTLFKIGREYNLGIDELRLANPGVDQWLPGEGTALYLPTQIILPDAPRKGIVVNVPAMRLYYYTTEPDPANPAAKITKVTSHPIGIGAEGWATPIGEAKVTGKARDPIWYVPASVRKEHAARGDPLPSIVKPGPDNPLGAFAMALSIPSYLIHGTNNSAGVGMRSSHGCIRLYPEDIAELFDRVPKGTSVRMVNQPVLAGWRDGQLYLEVHPALVEETRDLAAEAKNAIATALVRGGQLAPVVVDDALVARIVTEQRGIPLPVLRTARSPEQFLAAARIVENTTPIDPPEQTAQAGGDSARPAAVTSGAR